MNLLWWGVKTRGFVCRFDVILDCTGKTTGFSHDLLKPWTNAKYVTLSPPTLRNFDDRGIVGGLVKSGIDLLAANSSAILEGKTLRWAYFVPSSQALTSLCDLARDHKVWDKPLLNCSIFIFFFCSLKQLLTAFIRTKNFLMRTPKWKPDTRKER